MMNRVSCLTLNLFMRRNTACMDKQAGRSELKWIIQDLLKTLSN